MASGDVLISVSLAARRTRYEPGELVALAASGAVAAVEVSGQWWFHPDALPPRRVPLTSTGELPDLLLPSEVAGLFKVHVKTVTRWAREGRLPSTWTLGGHRRFPSGPIRELLQRGWEET